MIKVEVIRDEYLFPNGSTFYLAECTNGITDGFHVFANADGTGWVCNLNRAAANRIFNI